MPKLKMTFTQETIITRKQVIQIEYAPESRTSNRQRVSKNTSGDKEKGETMIAVIFSQIRKG